MIIIYGECQKILKWRQICTLRDIPNVDIQQIKFVTLVGRGFQVRAVSCVIKWDFQKKKNR